MEKPGDNVIKLFYPSNLPPFPGNTIILCYNAILPWKLLWNGSKLLQYIHLRKSRVLNYHGNLPLYCFITLAPGLIFTTFLCNLSRIYTIGENRAKLEHFKNAKYFFCSLKCTSLEQFLLQCKRSFTNEPNKLECLSLVSLSNLVI